MKLSELAELIGVSFDGEDREIGGIHTLQEADATQLSFLDNPKYAKLLPQTKAAAVLLHPKFAGLAPEGTAALISEEPYLKMALATARFAPRLSVGGGTPEIGEGSRIGPGVHFGEDVKIGQNVTIMPGAFIGDRVTIGDGVLIYANATVYHECVIGDRVIVHAGSVIGSDGFGFAHTKAGEHVKIHQLGNVVVENDVEIGANCTIDRAAFGTTFIKTGVKMDNQVQIGHNVVVGAYSIIVAQCAIAGSTKLGRNVVMGGQSAINGHIEIGDFVTLAARSGVVKSVPSHSVYAGAPAIDHKKWLRLNAILSRMANQSKKDKA